MQDSGPFLAADYWRDQIRAKQYWADGHKLPKDPGLLDRALQSSSILYGQKAGIFHAGKFRLLFRWRTGHQRIRSPKWNRIQIQQHLRFWGSIVDWVGNLIWNEQIALLLKDWGLGELPRYFNVAVHKTRRFKLLAWGPLLLQQSLQHFFFRFQKPHKLYDWVEGVAWATATDTRKDPNQSE